jgi:hypothetical protein
MPCDSVAPYSLAFSERALLRLTAKVKYELQVLLPVCPEKSTDGFL